MDMLAFDKTIRICKICCRRHYSDMLVLADKFPALLLDELKESYRHDQ